MSTNFSSHGVQNHHSSNRNLGISANRLNTEQNALSRATNSKLDQANTTLSAILVDTDAADSSLNTIEAQSVLTASRLNNIQNKISENTDGTGNTLGQLQVLTNTKLDTIATNTANIKISTDSVNLNVDTLETLTTSTNTKLDTIDAVLDTIKTDSAAIKTAVELLDNTVSGNELQVDVLSMPTTTVSGTITANLSATDNAVLDDIASKLGDVKTSVELLDNTVSGNELQVDVLTMPTTTVTGTITANLSATDNAVLDDIASKLGDVKTSVELLDNAVSGNELQVDVLTMPTTTVTGTITANLSATDNAVLDDIASKLGDVKIATEALDNAVSGNELQVDVVASLPAGDNNIGNVDIASALPAGTNAIGKLAANSGVDIGDVDVTSIAAGTNRIGHVVARANEAADGSGTERHLLCDSAGHLQVDVVSAPSTAVTGTVTANLSATDNAVLDDIAQKAGDIETSVQLIDDIVKAEDAAHSSGDKGVMFLGVRQSSQADFGADGDYVPISINDDGEIRVTTGSSSSGGATEAKQDIIETTLTNLETSLQALDNAVDGNYLNVNLNVAGSDVDANSGNKSAASQRVVIATDDVNMSAIKTATEASATDLAALEILQTSTNTKLDTLETTLTAIETDQAAIEVLLTGIDADTDACKTSLAALDNAVDGNYLNVNLNVAGSDVDANSGNKSAASQRVVIATDDVNMSAIKTATQAAATDLAALEILQTSTNTKLDTIDGVLDNIKIDTEAIETAVEAIQALDQLTTTLIIDGQTVTNGGGTHTSSSFEVTKRPKGDGKLHFLVRISGVSAGDISVGVLLSADDTNFFGVDLGFINQGTTTTGVGQFVTCSFVAKHVKIILTNTSFSSNATCSVHMFT